MTEPTRDATRPASLQAVEAAVWHELAQAGQQRGHAWRHPVLATIDGDAADARTVVLRDLDAEARMLLIYTDARSPKVRQIEAHPLGTLVLWSPRLAWQLRARVELTLVTSGLAVSSRWARLKLTPSAQDYLSPQAPGTPLDGPVPLPERTTRENFALLSARVLSLDWLELHAQGPRRAAFDEHGARWLTP